MRTHAIVSPQFWTGETGRMLRDAGPDAQRIALYLMTCPNSNMIGLYYLPIPTMCHELGISPQGASKGLRRVSEGGFAHYDEDTETVWVPEMARFQIGESLAPKDNRIKHIVKLLPAYRKTAFLREFLEKYGDAYSLPDACLSLASEAPSKPLRSQEQEQEQEQEQGKKKSKQKKISPTDINAVVRHYREYHPEIGNGGVARRKIADRIREGFTVAKLCKAIDGNHVSPFHCGENDRGTKYHSLELICRDHDHVVKFLEIAQAGPQPVMSEKERRSLRSFSDARNAQRQLESVDSVLTLGVQTGGDGDGA